MRPAPGRSRTSCSSCKRTAASTTFFQGYPVPTRLERQELQGETDPAAAVRSNRSVRRSDHSAQAIVRRLRRRGQDSRVTDAEWTASTSRARILRRLRSIPQYVVRRRDLDSQAVLGHGRTNGCWPTRCLPVATRRKLSSRISTSSPVAVPEADGASVDLPRRSSVGLRRRQARRDPHDHRRSPVPYGHDASRPCFDHIRRSRDELDAAGLSWRVLRAAYGSNRAGRARSGRVFEAVKTSARAPIGS